MPLFNVMIFGYSIRAPRILRIFPQPRRTAPVLSSGKQRVGGAIFLLDIARIIGRSQIWRPKMAGYQDAFAKLKEQLTSYDKFVRTDVLPQARDDFRLPPELYTISLENYGIDYAPDELTRLAHEMFTQLQSQMQSIAARSRKSATCRRRTIAP